jgi:hypothetical protein
MARTVKLFRIEDDGRRLAAGSITLNDFWSSVIVVDCGNYVTP